MLNFRGLRIRVSQKRITVYHQPPPLGSPLGDDRSPSANGSLAVWLIVLSADFYDLVSGGGGIWTAEVQAQAARSPNPVHRTRLSVEHGVRNLTLARDEGTEEDQPPTTE